MDPHLAAPICPSPWAIMVIFSIFDKGVDTSAAIFDKESDQIKQV